MDRDAVTNFLEVAGEDEIRERFIGAGSLLLEYDLLCESRRLQITALGLYLFHPELWPDESTDRDREGVQLEDGLALMQLIDEIHLRVNVVRVDFLCTKTLSIIPL